MLTHHVDSDCSIGTHRNVVIAVWRRETTVAGVEAFSAFIAERSRMFGSGMLLLQVIEESASAPSPTARKALATMHREKASLIRRSAIVYTKPGFAGATARAIITGVAMLNPPSFEHKHFATISDAIGWLELDATFDRSPRGAKMLELAIEELRALQGDDASARAPSEAAK